MLGSTCFREVSKKLPGTTRSPSLQISSRYPLPLFLERFHYYLWPPFGWHPQLSCPRATYAFIKFFRYYFLDFHLPLFTSTLFTVSLLVFLIRHQFFHYFHPVFSPPCDSPNFCACKREGIILFSLQIRKN